MPGGLGTRSRLGLVSTFSSSAFRLGETPFFCLNSLHPGPCLCKNPWENQKNQKNQICRNYVLVKPGHGSCRFVFFVFFGFPMGFCTSAPEHSSCRFVFFGFFGFPMGFCTPAPEHGSCRFGFFGFPMGFCTSKAQDTRSSSRKVAFRLGETRC